MIFFIKIILKVLPLFRFHKITRFVLNLLHEFDIGLKTKIGSDISFFKGVKIIIGANSFIGMNCVFTGGINSSIRIGNNCDISDHVHFVTGTHLINPIKSNERRAGKGISEDIIIEDNVWIGYRSTILPGVKIGKNSIIAGGTVVYKDVPPGSLVVSHNQKLK